MTLLVENNPRRVEWFRARLGPIPATPTADQAIQILGSSKIDKVLLDYDLDGSKGSEVAEFLAVTGKRPEVLVHSMNPFGGKATYDYLRKHGFRVTYIPYALLITLVP